MGVVGAGCWSGSSSVLRARAPGSPHPGAGEAADGLCVCHCQRESGTADTGLKEKKAEQEHVDAAVGRAGLNLNRLGTAEINLAEHGAAALSNSASDPLGAFSDLAQTIPNIKSLLPADQKKRGMKVRTTRPTATMATTAMKKPKPTKGR